MNPFSLFMTFILISLSVLADEHPTTLILNMPNEEMLPQNFRTSQTPYNCIFCKKPSKEGLRDLRISGSGQFSQRSWQSLVKAINHEGPIIDVDLRQETHGFLNGAAISLYSTQNWRNVGKSDFQINEEEISWLEQLEKSKATIVNIVKVKDDKNLIKTKPVITPINYVLTEQEMTARTNAKYFRLYVTDHRAPVDSEVDKFIQFVRHLPQNTWLHFHCKAGAGRTTTFMAMYDIMHNAKKVSFEDIITRQNLIGGLDLFRTPDSSHWKFPLVKERIEFLKAFHNYSKNNIDSFSTSWSSYLSHQEDRKAERFHEKELVINGQ